MDHVGFMHGEYAMLTVRDNSYGMDSLFEPFFATKELGEGTDLGLALATTSAIYLPRHLSKTVLLPEK